MRPQFHLRISNKAKRRVDRTPIEKRGIYYRSRMPEITSTLAHTAHQIPLWKAQFIEKQ